MNASAVPARRFDAQGRPHVDLRALLALALPLFVNSTLQAVLNLTDTWFVGRLSSTAVAAVGATYWLVLGLLLLVGGVGMVVQSFAAQAQGAGRHARASHATWQGLWCAILSVPLFLLLSMADRLLIPAMRLDPEIARLGAEYWGPRLLGGPLAVALWALLSFFMGVGRVGVALTVNVAVALVNAAANAVFIFGLGWGVAGAAWATDLSLLVGVACALLLFLSGGVRRQYASHRTWRFRGRTVRTLVTVGLGAGAAIAFDLLGLSLFQVMMTQLGAVEGAATQIAMMLTSIAYMPAVGLGMAGTTLVGQAIGAGDRAWATRLGNVTILLAMGYMGTIGVVLAAAGPWVVPFFLAAGDAQAADVMALGTTLLWFAAAYQAFDGLNIGSGFSLRAAGDTRVPAMLLALLSLGVFVPLAHTLAFGPGQGWVDWAPTLGLGAAGGWAAAVVYVGLLGSTLFVRWRTGAWQRIRLG